MSYIVVYQRADGSSGLEECSSLDLAVVAAERLRNVDSVENPRIFKTEEVSFDFRPYYRVEVSEESAEHAPPPPIMAGASVVTKPEPVATPKPVATPDPAAPTPTTAPTAEAAPISQPEVMPEPAVPAEPTLTPETAIDPWASAEASPIDYSKPTAAPSTPDSAVEATPEPAEFAPVDASAEVVVEAEPEVADPVPSPSASDDEDSVWPSRGLFSPNVPESPKDPSSSAGLAEDVTDAVPPRRGLFGR